MKSASRILFLALFLVAVILVLVSCSNTVEIAFWTNDTKAEWVHEVTGPFNEAQHQTPSGKTIVVNVEEIGSSGQPEWPGVPR